jgi:hypothetical protein
MRRDRVRGHGGVECRSRSLGPAAPGGPFFLDINSVSPSRKQQTAKLIGDSGRYVDVAVIAPIHPARH